MTKTHNTDESFIPLYPELIPFEEGHPTSARFVVEDTGDVRGKGLKSKVAFRAGDYVAKLSGVLVNNTTLNTIQITETLLISDPWFCRFLLHSCDPSLEFDIDHFHVTARRDISPGEYLTVDYARTDDEVAVQFACKCGSPNCRGWITGRNQEVNEEGRAFLARQ